ncbi:hypothetical protein ACTID9_02120 [Brevibacillus fluminis]|uniref:hypothetical protein n=1 Tax=Brevibacillus fluminis TaxID=511487 RepID=UPI003F8B1F21
MSTIDISRKVRDDFAEVLRAQGINLVDNSKIVKITDGNVEFEYVLKYSKHTSATGYSFTIKESEFGEDDSTRYYVFALIEPEPTRYIILSHRTFKQLMETPLESPTYKNTGSYTFNFGKNSDKLGKWESFLSSPLAFVNLFNPNDDKITIKVSELRALKSQIDALGKQVDSLKQQLSNLLK